MNELTDKLSIEIWQKIAKLVQGLEFSNCGCEEYKKNLNTLKYLLENSGINSRTGSRYPHHKKEVGVSTLLQAIYDLKERKNKSLFYEQIYTLKELGIQEVEYCPCEFYKQILEMKKEYYRNGGKIICDKAYTDGTFELETTTTISRKKRIFNYDITNLQNANFILNLLIEKFQNGKDEKTVLKKASAALKNFKGKYPCKEEIISDSFPSIKIPQQVTTFDGTFGKVKEIYAPFESSNLSCSRRLIKNKDGNWYYAE